MYFILTLIIMIFVQFKLVNLSANASEMVPFDLDDGLPARRENWPFLASIYYSQKKDFCLSKIPLCTGTVIGPRWVLTAAHCIPPTQLFKHMDVFVRMDVYQLQSKKGIEVSTSIYYVHPKYKYLDKYDINRTFLYVSPYDIGLLKLDYPMLYNRDIQGIHLSTRLESTGATCLAQGWGTHYSTHIKNCKNFTEYYPLKGTLYEIKQSILDQEICHQLIFHVMRAHYTETGIKIKPLSSKELSESFLCTEQVLPKSIAPYKGDAGGPLVCHAEQLGVALVICQYTIWTRVGKYSNWINEIISNNNSKMPRFANVGNILNEKIHLAHNKNGLYSDVETSDKNEKDIKHLKCLKIVPASSISINNNCPNIVLLILCTIILFSSEYIDFYNIYPV